MTEPLPRRLHSRGETITVGALPWVTPVYRAMPQVAAVIELPFAHGGLQWTARRSLARQLRGLFDVAYVCPNSLKSALLPWWAGIPKRVGYHGESRYGLLNQRLPNPPDDHRPPMVAFYSALSGETGVANDRPELHMDAVKVDAALAGMHLQRQGYYVFAPGAGFGPAKRWPVRHFAVLGEQLPLPRSCWVLPRNRRSVPKCRHRQCSTARPMPTVRPHVAGPCFGRHCDLVIATHGRSFWVLDNIGVLRQLGSGKDRSERLFAPAPAVREVDEGVAIDYFLPARPQAAGARHPGARRRVDPELCRQSCRSQEEG